MSTSSPLAKRTVAQLKAICKELGVKNYSKLGKAALIERIQAAQSAAAPASAQGHAVTNARSGSAAHRTLNNALATSADTYTPSSVGVEDGLRSPLSKPARAVNKPPSRTVSNDPPTPPVYALPSNLGAQEQHERGSADQTNVAARSASGSAPASSSSPGLKRPAHEPVLEPSAKRARITAAAPLDSPPRELFKMPAVPQRSKTRKSSQVPMPPRFPTSVAAIAKDNEQPAPFNPVLPTTNFRSAAVHATPTSAKAIPAQANPAPTPINTLPAQVQPPARRFKALRPVTVTHISPAAPAFETVPRAHHTNCSLQLDFTLVPPSPMPAARPIVLPMPLRQRRQARIWAIVLMRLTDKERVQCVLVSKAVRYGVYLSAAQILRSDFLGARLASALRGVETDIKDIWPYLRARWVEAAACHAAYEASFLPRFFARFGIRQSVSTSLWSSPDHEHQLTVAIRFLIAKVWFAVSLGGSDARMREWLDAVVLDAQEVVKDTVWTITQQRAGRAPEALYVLYETCEVIGGGGGDVVPLRHDWAQHVADGALARKPLMDHVTWHNGEEYARGISKAWLRRVAGDGVLVRVAERYVLACVAANSVSGRFKTAREMADEFAGVDDGAGPAGHKGAQALNLYLPEHHYVEGVSFFAADGRTPLHPALAAVQTPGREYIVLRDIAMHVGSEEEGVADVWMELIGCDAKGVVARY